MVPIEILFKRLGRSRFRSRFFLRKHERRYLSEKGMETVLAHGLDFIRQRLAPASPSNDGRQTPMSKHPFFVAQHATATCCRGCLRKWHDIPVDRPLTAEEITYVLEVNAAWLYRQLGEKASVR
jgi:hypothetical protein